jgi:tRNA nucleotidyltransferase (CCA-adding enzyme)
MIASDELARAVPVLERLEREGFEAVFVGGCIRDYVLGRTLKDVDIATSATPDQVTAVFPRTVPTGLRHGTVTVIWEDETYEVTTFRKESVYEDHRRPSAVEFVTDLEGDLLRRDFTINALAMRTDGTIVDPFGGQRDLRMRVLRCVGDADARFQEDALRMMRAVRFAAELGLRIAPGTWRALKRHRSLLRHVAMERIGAEADKIMSGAAPHHAAAWFAASGLARHTKLPLPETVAAAADYYAAGPTSNREPRYEAMRERIAAIAGLNGADDRWAALGAALSLSADESCRMFEALRFSSVRTAGLASFARLDGAMRDALHRYRDGWGKREQEAQDRLRRSWLDEVLREGAEIASRWLRVADKLRLAESPDSGGELEKLAEWQRDMPVRSLKELAVRGSDIVSAVRGPSGPWLGHMLGELLRRAAFGEVPNEREPLLALAARLHDGNENCSGKETP